MEDLSHWDWAEHFSGYDAAALILGLEPSQSEEEQWRVRVVTGRMELDFKRAVEKCLDVCYGDQINNSPAKSSEDVSGFNSVPLQELERVYGQRSDESPFSAPPFDKRMNKFDFQEFSRAEIVRWLSVVGMKSVYKFDCQPRSDADSNLTTRSDLDIDPTELPEELDAANVAYRVVLNGFDVKTGTFKSKLIEFLRSNYPHFNDETVERVATVANPHKTRGRRKREAESAGF
jgi:hypothetical protein